MSTIAQALALGLEHHQAGRLPHAEQIYRQVLDAHPENGDALHLLGTLAMQAGRRDEGISLLERAVALRPTNSVYHGNLGSAYAMVERHADALEALRHAIRHDPANADAHYNLGTVLAHFGQLDEAAASYRRCLELRPANRAAHNNLGDVLRMQGQLASALEHVEAALAIDPSAPHVHFNRALVWLGMGKLREGFDEYEWRWRCNEFARRQFTQPLWHGSTLGDKTLLLYAEQGLGDTIQFLRYLPLVRERCRNLLVEVPGSLMQLCRESCIEGVVEATAASDGQTTAVLPHFDVQLPMGSLPHVFGTTLESIPALVPYLEVGQQRVAAWREALAPYSGFRVGIAWQGRPTHPEDRYRSVPLASFAPLAAVDGVRLVSLQTRQGHQQVAALGGQFEVIDFASRTDKPAGTIEDMAAIIKNLDLVITVDTVVAHLAGALGVPVWVALRIGPDWRWLLDRRDSPWYPTMRLFRQRRFGDWPQVFDDVTAELRHVAGLSPQRSAS